MAANPVEKNVDLRPARAILQEMGQVDSGDLIPLLQRLQEAYGYLPREVLLSASEQTGIPASRMYGVATFYEQFHLKPRGRHTVRVCRGTACHVRGAPQTLAAVELALGIIQGETTDDLRFTLETVACLGTCFLAPVIMVDKDYHGNVKLDKVAKVLDKYK
jgi:NADH-quinone oxidoreductase subunit E